MHEGMDRGSNQEMTYPEFAEAVGRIAYEHYRFKVGPDASDTMDHDSAEVISALVQQFNETCDVMKRVFRIGP